jgi:hypothetical protein
MAIRFELDENNAVKCFKSGSNVPFSFQPNWPNGDAWVDAAEATAWAELYLASINDPEAPYAPQKRGVDGLAKPPKAKRDAISALLIQLEAATTLEQKIAITESLDEVYKNM